MINVNLFDLVADLTELKDYVGDSVEVIIYGHRISINGVPSSCDEDRLEEIMEDTIAFHDADYEICKDINGYWKIEIVI
jgi:hypothetical protein